MSRYRSHTASFIFSLFVVVALYISGLISVRNHTTIFIALLTLGWHILANMCCSFISSYRFKNPAAKYIEIKNKFVRKLLIRPFFIGGLGFASKGDNRTNIIGIVLNIINTLLFVIFEVLLLMPKIYCDPYVFTLTLGRRPHNFVHLDFELCSVNEIIAAESSRAFALIMAFVFFAFIILFERRLKEHRQKITRNTARTPCKNPFKKTEWYSTLYNALVDISVRRNKKKHKFWYNKEQLEQIENLVKTASVNAELKLTKKENEIVSFTVIDVLNKSIGFTGFFI